MQALKGLGQATEMEQKIVADTIFDVYDDKETLFYKMDLIEKALADGRRKAELSRKVQGQPPLQGQVAPAGSTVSSGDDEDLLNQYAPKQ
jgi:hypothetical protein